MASGPIISWQIDGKTVETVAEFIFLGSKITADGDCSHEIKRCLLLGREVMTNLDSILKCRDVTLPTKVCLVKAMVFPVVMYRCESWTVKKAECWRIDAFELWCWRLLKVPWTARRSNQSILKEISPGCSLEGRTDVEAETPILCPPDAKSWLIWKDSDAGRDWEQEEKGMTEDETVGWHHRLEHGFGWTLGVVDGQGGLACCGSWTCKESNMTERLNWTKAPILLCQDYEKRSIQICYGRKNSCLKQRKLSCTSQMAPFTGEQTELSWVDLRREKPPELHLRLGRVC